MRSIPPVTIAVGVAVFFGVIAVIKVVIDGDDIEVSLFDPITLTITNVSQIPVTVRAVEINGRKDCIVRTGIIATSEKFEVRTLESGDKGYWVNTCNIVRAKIVTDSGSEEYSFR